jgi:putative endonuclease
MKTNYMNRNYYVYILTNINRQVLYVGVTNDIARRLFEHEEDAKGDKKTFAGKYNCIYLLYYERYQYVNYAIAREKELKGWTREKKNALIRTMNPELKSLNDEV